MHSYEFDLGMEDFIAFCPSHPFKANHFHDHPSFAESSQWIGVASTLLHPIDQGPR